MILRVRGNNRMPTSLAGSARQQWRRVLRSSCLIACTSGRIAQSAVLHSVLAKPWRKCFPKTDFGFDRVQALPGIMGPRQCEKDTEANITNANAMLAI
jgi:hypothetical protein